MTEGRAIRLVSMDKSRPAVVLTREAALPVVSAVTVAPIVTRAAGLHTEVAVGPENGLDNPSVIHCDTVTSVPVAALGRRIGSLLPHQERALTAALLVAFDLDLDAEGG